MFELLVKSGIAIISGLGLVASIMSILDNKEVNQSKKSVADKLNNLPKELEETEDMSDEQKESLKSARETYIKNQALKEELENPSKKEGKISLAISKIKKADSVLGKLSKAFSMVITILSNLGKLTSFGIDSMSYQEQKEFEEYKRNKRYFNNQQSHYTPNQVMYNPNYGYIPNMQPQPLQQPVYPKYDVNGHPFDPNFPIQGKDCPLFKLDLKRFDLDNK